jgi:glycosyltransferase involved in cell wall biosynthesis
MNMTDSVSVVIPTYNSSNFIRQTLESVFRQTRLPCEVIVVDDGSTDCTRELVTAIAQTAPVSIRLHCLPHNSGGPARPLNVGIAQAAGPLIATLDHDDLMLPDKLELQVACLNRNEHLGLVLSNFYFYRDNVRHDVAPLATLRECVGEVTLPMGEACYRIKARDLYAALIDKSMAGSCSNFLFPKRVWAACGGFDEQLTSCCDHGFMQAVAREHDMGVVDHTLFYYNWLDESLYRVAQRLVLKRDRLRIFTLFEPALLSAERQSNLRGRIRSELLGGAHLLRNQGAYGKSLSFYLQSIYSSGWSNAAVLGIAKLVPHKLLRCLSATERPVKERSY